MSTRRSGLGRGLDALLPQSTPAQESREGLLHVSIDDVDPNPRQPRSEFDHRELDELSSSIASLGILQPLLVRPKPGGRYELIAGERRLRGARLAGLTEIPILVVETDERGSLERAIVENVHRSDLNPIEEAAAYKQLIDEGGLTQEQLGERLGKNRVTVSNSLRLLELPTSVQQLLMGKRLTTGHGKALLTLQGNPMQERLARRASEEGMSVRETEALARKFEAMGAPAGGRGGSRGPLPASVTEAQRRLADHLQTRVRVEPGKRKGKIVIDFVSMEELERLMDTILGEEPGGMPNRVSLD